MVANPLLVESSLFAYDTFFSEPDYAGTAAMPKLATGNAVERGWTPVDLPGAANGVQTVDLSGFVPPDSPIAGATITSAVHFYEGELEGKNTLAIAFRSTDEGDAEFAFQSSALPPNPLGAKYGWDLYYALHAPVVAEALGLAADPASGVEQVLITGHSLGGILAELTSARLLADPASPLGSAAELLADKTLTVTYGSPGSTADASGLKVFNVYHTDDLVARLSDLSPLFEAGGAAREGVDLAVARPEGDLDHLRPKNLDTPEEVFAALQNPAYRVEHNALLYIDTAKLLSDNERLIPGVADAHGDPDRWLLTNADHVRIGTDGNDVLKGAPFASSVLFGQDGDDVLKGGHFTFPSHIGLSSSASISSSDGLAGGDGNDRLFGFDGPDRLDGGPGNDVLRGGGGSDVLFASTGTDLLEGGPGQDTAVFDGQFADYAITLNKKSLVVELSGPVPETATLHGVELLQFDDGSFAFHKGKLEPVPEAATTVAADLLPVASVDSLVASPEPS